MVQIVQSNQDHSGAVYALCGGKGSSFYSGGADKVVALWGLPDLKQTGLAIRTENPVWSLFFSEIAMQVAIGESNGMLSIVDVAARAEIRRLQLHDGGIHCILQNEPKQAYYTCGADGRFNVLDKHWDLVRSIPLSTTKLRKAAVKPDGKFVAVADNEGFIHVLETEFYNEVVTIDAHPGGVSAVQWHPHKDALFSGGKDALLKVWKWPDGEEIASIPAHNYAIYDIVFDHVGTVFGTSSRDKSVKFWDATTLEFIEKLTTKEGGHSHSVNQLIFHDGCWISAGDDRKIIVWKEKV